MSGYGWLTQSTIVPKKSKEIKISDAGLYDLKATILQYKNKKLQQKPNQKKQLTRNRGVQARNVKDEQELRKRGLNEQESYAYKCLLGKQKVYDSLQEKSVNHKALLVDFQGKKMKQAQQEYESLKQDFYNGKLADNKRQRQLIYEREMQAGQSGLRQRLNWEKQVLIEMKGGLREEKLLVAQSFDRKLDKEEKQALSKIIAENKQKDRSQGQWTQSVRKIRKVNQ